MCNAAGKSSLLAAILGELRGNSGRVKIQGSLAYVPQQPWVMSGTLRDNILFKKQVTTLGTTFAIWPKAC